MTKLTFKLGRYDEALAHYKTLLTYTKKAVTRNVAEKAINRILDYVSADTGLGLDKMQEFYEVTMSALEEQKNEVRPLSQRPPTARPPADARSPSCSQRLSTKTNLKLAKLWLDRHEYARLNKVRPPRSGPLPLAQLAHAPPSPADPQGASRPVRALGRRRRRRLVQGHDAARGVRPRDPDVRRDEEQQEAARDLREEPSGPVGHPAPEDPGRHPRVRRQDVHVGECVLAPSSCPPPARRRRRRRRLV